MIWILLVIYQLKHFLADYPLQGKYMLGKFKPYPQFILPLLAHALVHGLFTYTIVYLFHKGVYVALGLAAFDMGIHFVVDRIKASPNMLGQFKALSANEYVNEILPVLNDPDDMGGRSAITRTGGDTKFSIAMKRIKSNTYFWWALGWDQMMHHLTHYALIAGILYL